MCRLQRVQGDGTNGFTKAILRVGGRWARSICVNSWSYNPHRSSIVAHSRINIHVFVHACMHLPTGSGRNSLHLALWGTLDTNSNTLEMTVGLPAETLAKAGLRGLPPGYMLPVAVSGPLHRPQVEWNAAGEAATAKAGQLLLHNWGFLCSCSANEWLARAGSALPFAGAHLTVFARYRAAEACSLSGSIVLPSS